VTYELCHYLDNGTVYCATWHYYNWITVPLKLYGIMQQIPVTEKTSKVSFHIVKTIWRHCFPVIDHFCYNTNILSLDLWPSQAVVTYTSPIEAFATGIKMESSDQHSFLEPIKGSRQILSNYYQPINTPS